MRIGATSDILAFGLSYEMRDTDLARFDSNDIWIDEDEAEEAELVTYEGTAWAIDYVRAQPKFSAILVCGTGSASELYALHEQQQLFGAYLYASPFARRVISLETIKHAEQRLLRLAPSSAPAATLDNLPTAAGSYAQFWSGLAPLLHHGAPKLLQIALHDPNAHDDAKPLESNLSKRFDQLSAKWLNDTEWVSSIGTLTKHPAFAEIVAMGEPALRLILRRMANGDIRIHWFPALKAIAKDDPVPVENRGRVRAMAAEWLQWGRNKGYLEPHAVGHIPQQNSR